MAFKVYEVEASITLNFNFEVDAVNKSEANTEARVELEKYMRHLKKDYEDYDINIDAVEESEGH